jgi:hypothetical protein
MLCTGPYLSGPVCARLLCRAHRTSFGMSVHQLAASQMAL